MKRPIVLPATLALLSACGGNDPAPADAPVDEAAAVAEVEDTAPAADAAETGAPGEEMAAGTAAEAAATGTVAAATPPASFAQCKVCHAVEPGKNGLGPSLAGVFGATAGHEPSFAYSPAMKQSGLVWDEANLHAYLENPRIFIPGNRMSFAGIRDEAKRKEVIDYLKTL